MMHCRYFDTARNSNHSATLTPTVVCGRRSLPFENCAESDTPVFEKCWLRQISAYNVTTIGDSKKSSIITHIKSTTAFPWAIDVVRMLPISPEKVTQKSDFFIFPFEKGQLQSNKICYKVSLCENFQQQSCIMTIPVSNGPYILHKC